MEQYYPNRPSDMGAMTAEEYAATLGLRNQSDRDCDCDRKCDCKCDHKCDHKCDCDSCPTDCSQLVCCCHPVTPCPKPIEVDEGCCCKESFRAALRLLCDDELTDLLDFDMTAFVTNDYTAGAGVTQTVAEEAPADNLTEPLAGTFRRFSPGTCDLLDISAELFAAPETATNLTVTQVNLCELVAVIIQLAETEAEGELTAEQVAARNFRRVRRILARSLSPNDACSDDDCTCADCEDCCCAAGLLSALSGSNLSRRVSLAAGPLLLNGLTLLGNVGNVLVLANEEALRFYFVCVTHIQFLA